MPTRVEARRLDRQQRDDSRRRDDRRGRAGRRRRRRHPGRARRTPIVAGVPARGRRTSRARRCRTATRREPRDSADRSDIDDSASASSATATGDRTWSATSAEVPGCQRRRGQRHAARPAARRCGPRYPAVETTADYRRPARAIRAIDAVVDRDAGVDATSTWRCRRSQAGKHVFVEKPLTATAEQALRLIDEAERRSLVLARRPHVRLHRRGPQDPRAGRERRPRRHLLLRLGAREPRPVPARRQRDLGPGRPRPVDHGLRAAGAAGRGLGDRHRATSPGEPENIAYLTLFFDEQPDRAHPRQLARAGEGAPDADRRQPQDDRLRRSRAEREDQGLRQGHHASTATAHGNGEQRYQMLVGYRTGDMWAPQLDMTEALSVEAQHFVACIEQRPDADRPTATPACAWSASSRPRRSRCAERGRVVELDTSRGAPHDSVSRSESAVPRRIKPEIDAAVARVLESGAVRARRGSRRVRAGVRRATAAPTHGIAVNTGTSALHLALLAAGVGPGDEVITVPFTFVATVAAIGYTGATPVFVDIDPASFTMDVDAARSGDHAADQGDPAGAPLRAAGRHGSDHRDRAAATA